VTLASALALLAATQQASAIPLILDEFDGPPGGQSVSLLCDPVGQNATDVASGTGAVGDTRRVGVHCPTFGPALPFLEVDVNGNGSSGTFLFVFSESGPFVAANLFYDAQGAGLDLDLTSKFRFFTLEGVSVDQDTQVSILTEAAVPGNGCCIGSGTSVTVPAGFSGDLQFDRSYFQGDLTQVFSLRVDVLVSAAPIGGRVQIARFVANLAPIPEPATALMLGAALAGLAFWRRREVP
jgi:hypothetical protein